MARKVGFDRPDTEPKKSIADSYLDEFRKKHNHDLSPNTQPMPKAPKRKREWVSIIFMMVWISGWSIGILFALGVLMSGTADAFLLIWLAFAILGWFVAVFVLTALLRGREPFQKSKK